MTDTTIHDNPTTEAKPAGTPDPEVQEVAELEQETPEPRQRAADQAAKYRVRAREAETQAAELTERVAALQTAEVDRILTDLGYTPKGFWATGAQLSDFTTDTGTINPDAVQQAAQGAAIEYGLQQARLGFASAPLEGTYTPPVDKPDGMAGALSPR